MPPPINLTDRQIRNLREAYAKGATQVELAKKYKISQPTVNRIVNGMKRANAGGPIKSDRNYRKDR